MWPLQNFMVVSGKAETRTVVRTPRILFPSKHSQKAYQERSRCLPCCGLSSLLPPCHVFKKEKKFWGPSGPPPRCPGRETLRQQKSTVRKREEQEKRWDKGSTLSVPWDRWPRQLGWEGLLLSHLGGPSGACSPLACLMAAPESNLGRR